MVVNDINKENVLSKLTINDDIITYDAMGNPVTIGTKELTWKNGRELATITDGDLNVSYEYDLNGIRVSKTINNEKTNYYIEEKTILYEDRNGNIIGYLYSGGDLIGFNYDSKTYYYHKNIFNDIIGIYDSNYQEIVKYTYDNLGKIISIVDNSANNIGTINPFRYRSYYYDEESGLYYLNSRYYNPLWGRFINADAFVIQDKSMVGYNLYVYCNNNFLNLIDNLGNWGISFDSMIKGAISFGKKAWNGLETAGKTVCNGAKKIASSIADKVDKMINGKKSFTFDFKVGLGFEIDNGKKGLKVGGDKSIGFDNLGGHYTTTNGGLSLFDFGLSGEIRNYDDGYGNPMAMPWDVWDDQRTTKSYGVGFSQDIISDTDYANSIGLSADKDGNVNYDSRTNGKDGVSFETNRDLYLSLHDVHIQVIGNVKKGDLHVRLYDKYDFKYEDIFSKGPSKILFMIGNNMAFADQQLRVINPYNIFIDIEYSISNSCWY